MAELMFWPNGEPEEAKKRGKHYVQPRGYGGKVGAGPEGETCATCKHCVRMRSNSKRWTKCDLCRPKWTGGRATDILARAPACEKWEAPHD